MGALRAHHSQPGCHALDQDANSGEEICPRITRMTRIVVTGVSGAGWQRERPPFTAARRTTWCFRWTPTPCLRVRADGSRVRSRRQPVPSPLFVNVADRNRQGKSSVPISGRHFRRWLSVLQSTGVGLSSSAESTAPLSNDDIRSESPETEV